MLKLGYNQNDREEVNERLQVRLTLKDKVRVTAADARLQDEHRKDASWSKMQIKIKFSRQFTQAL